MAHMWRNLNGMARFYLGLRELIHPLYIEGRQALEATARRLLFILHIFSWFTVKNKVPFKPSNPTF